MITKEIYKRQLHEQLDEWNTQISELKDKADHAPDSDAEAEFNGQIEAIHALQQVANEKLQTLEHADETAWEHLKEEIEITWEMLESAIKKFFILYRD